MFFSDWLSQRTKPTLDFLILDELTLDDTTPSSCLRFLKYCLLKTCDGGNGGKGGKIAGARIAQKGPKR